MTAPPHYLDAAVGSVCVVVPEREGVKKLHSKIASLLMA